MASVFKAPEGSVSMALATGVLVWSIYSHVMPSVIDHRAADQDDTHAASAQKVAAWTSAGAVSAIALVTKDPTVFCFGGLMVIGLTLMHRHANMVNPLTGQAVASSSAPMMSPEESALPDAAYFG